MGWIILAIIVLLLASPLFVPVTVRARLDRERRDWSVHYGLLQVAPDTQVHLRAFRDRWARRLRYPTLAIKALFRAVTWLFSLVLLLLRWLTWPVRAPFRALQRRKARKQRERWEQERREREELPAPPLAQPPADESVPGAPGEGEASPLEGEGEAGAATPHDPGMDHPADPDAPWEMGDEAPEDGGESDGSKETDSAEDERTGTTEPAGEDREDEDRDSGREDSGEKKGSGFAARLRGMLSSWETARTKLDEGLAMIRLYGPPAKKVLRAFLLYLRGCARAFRFKTFDVQYSIGGDPAALGSLLGWHHALLASVDPRLPRHIVFQPDFDTTDIAPRGSLDVQVTIWPYRFILPTFAFVARLPWITAFKIWWRTRKR